MLSKTVTLRIICLRIVLHFQLNFSLDIHNNDIYYIAKSKFIGGYFNILFHMYYMWKQPLYRIKERYYVIYYYVISISVRTSLLNFKYCKSGSVIDVAYWIPWFFKFCYKLPWNVVPQKKKNKIYVKYYWLMKSIIYNNFGQYWQGH